MTIQVIPVEGIGEIERGADLAQIILDHADPGHRRRGGGDPKGGVQGRRGPWSRWTPMTRSHTNRSWMPTSVRVLRRRGDLSIAETKHGFVCANAGVDLSNVDRGWAALLPDDSDRSARRIRDGIMGRTDLDVAVIVTDTFGRPWRRGRQPTWPSAQRASSRSPIFAARGTPTGRELQVTEVAIVDEIAAAADLVMGKSAGIPVAGGPGYRCRPLRHWIGGHRHRPEPLPTICSGSPLRFR